MAPKRLSHCCCVTVRTGALILAIFGVTCGLATVAFYSFWLDNDVQIFEELDEMKFKYVTSSTSTKQTVEVYRSQN